MNDQPLPESNTAEGTPGRRPAAQGPLLFTSGWLWLTGTVAALLLLGGLAGRVAAGWGFGLLVFGGISLALSAGLFCVLVFSRSGAAQGLVAGSRTTFMTGAAAYVIAVCALAGSYGYETLQGRMELHWIIFGPVVVWALVAFDRGIYGKLVRKNLPTWHRFRTFISRDASDPAAMRRTLVDDVILQKALFRTSRVRWIRHALIFWGFAAMFATELVAVVVRDAVPAFGWRDIWREPGHPVRLAFDLAFDVTGLMVLVGCLIALVWRLSVRGKPERKFADAPMTGFLLFIVSSGFLVEGWRLALAPQGPGHAWSFVGVAFAYLLGPFVADSHRGYETVWLLHVIAACAWIGFLPATRLVHTCATPVGRLMNSQVGLLAAKKYGVLSGLLGARRASARLPASTFTRPSTND
jgi:hypothetical protein